MIEILNTDRVRVEGYVSAADLRYAKQGAKVRVWPSDLDRHSGDDKGFLEGQITFVALISDPIDRMTRVYADIHNRDNLLRSGHEAIMEIEKVDQVAEGETSKKADPKSSTSTTGQ